MYPLYGSTTGVTPGAEGTGSLNTASPASFGLHSTQNPLNSAGAGAGAGAAVVAEAEVEVEAEVEGVGGMTRSTRSCLRSKRTSLSAPVCARMRGGMKPHAPTLCVYSHHRQPYISHQL